MGKRQIYPKHRQTLETYVACLCILHILRYLFDVAPGENLEESAAPPIVKANMTFLRDSFGLNWLRQSQRQPIKLTLAEDDPQ